MDNYIKMIVDDDFVVTYTIKGKQHVRKYMTNMHQNRITKKFWADFGYMDETTEKFERIWHRTGEEYDPIKKSLDRRFQSHLDILTGKVKIYKVKQSILDDSCMPVQLLEDGGNSPMPYDPEMTYMLLGKTDNEQFDVELLSKDGVEYVTVLECFTRIRPVYWFAKKKV